MCKGTGTIVDRQVIEWTPGKFWVVDVTDRDTYIPLYHLKRAASRGESRAAAEGWLRANPRAAAPEDPSHG